MASLNLIDDRHLLVPSSILSELYTKSLLREERGYVLAILSELYTKSL